MARRSVHPETKRTGLIYRWMCFLSALLTFGPLVTFAVIGFADGSVHPGNKIVLGATLLTVIIMTGIAIANKITLRSRLWIALIGLWACLDYILPILLIFAGCQIVDELIICPIKRYYGTQYSTNKTVDRRDRANAKQDDNGTRAA